MNRNRESHLRPARGSQSGQAIILVVSSMVAFLGFCGLVVDVGRLYWSHRELQSSSDAAALAGAQMLPSTSAATTATNFSSVSGNLNSYPNLTDVTMVSGYPAYKCLATLQSQGIQCAAPANANAITVKQQAKVSMTFAPLVGTPSITITATATAAMRGSASVPYNVAIIVDSTASMQSSDGGSNCSGSRESCALQGVQVMLGQLSPCLSSQSSCGTVTGGNVANPVDKVSLVTFPAVSSATADYCGGGSISTTPYPLPAAPTYAPASSPTYQIVDFSSDYRSSDTATALTSASKLVAAVGGKAGCSGLQDPGGEGTYYPAAIYSAENLLLAQQAARPNAQNALIILGDGDANAKQIQMASTATNGGTYPSWNNECHQAITAAHWAATQGIGGTAVYTVAYGATSSGCNTDTPAISPCDTMRQMASSASKFYTDYSSTNNSCISASQTTTSLTQIFTKIAGDFTVARLIPNNTP